MAIRFVCCCGYHLRAREEMAGRRSMCPKCGAPVGVPLLEPTHRGATPVPPHARRESAARTDIPAALTHAAGTASRDCSSRRRDATTSVRLVTVRERRPPKWYRPRAWQLETRWYQCLRYPLRQLQLGPMLSLAGVLTFLCGVILLLWPRVIQANSEFRPWLIVLVPCLFTLPVSLGYSCLFLDRVLVYGAAAEVKDVGMPDLDPWPALQSLARWTACFLAGPALLAWIGINYWIRCGSVQPLDWLMLAEMLIPAVGYWLVALLVASQSDRLIDANPIRIIGVVRVLGSRGAAIALFACCLLVALGWLLFAAIEQLHRSPLVGFLLLGLFWSSGLFLGAFTCRVLGLCYYRALRRIRPAAIPLWAIPGRAFAPSGQV